MERKKWFVCLRRVCVQFPFYDFFSRNCCSYYFFGSGKKFFRVEDGGNCMKERERERGGRVPLIAGSRHNNTSVFIILLVKPNF